MSRYSPRLWHYKAAINRHCYPVLVNEVLSIVRDLKSDGMTMVLATHEMGFATQVADEVCFLESGNILERGSADEVLHNPKNPKTQEFLKRVHQAGRL